MHRLVSRFLSGLAWGAAATLVMGIARPANGAPKQIARNVMKGVLDVADATGQAREVFADLYAEAVAEEASTSGVATLPLS